jgi:hypothetical protein
MGHGTQLTVFALTNKKTNDGGKFTRQFLSGTKATCAVVAGFLVGGMM